MTTIKAHLSSVELEERYKTAVNPVAKSHFHALWLLFGTRPASTTCRTGL